MANDRHNVIIRVDAGEGYGLGHLFRMLALAAELAARSAAVALATATLPTVARHTKDYPIIHVPPVRLDEQLDMLAKKADCLITDHPELVAAETWPRLRRKTRIVRIDQPWAENSDGADLLVCPHMHLLPEQADGLERIFGDRFLYGPEYVIIRPEASSISESLFSARPHALICCTGGSASGVKELHTIQTALKDVLPNIGEVEFAYPEGCPAPELTPYAHAISFTSRRLSMAQCALTFFGVTPYEALYVGTPVLLLARTDTDVQYAHQLSLATDGAVQAAPQRWDRITDLGAWVAKALEGKWGLRERHFRALSLFDGHGAHRIAEEITKIL